MSVDSLSWTTYAILGLASLSAGFVDAAAGGGGLIQLPALILLFPYQPFAFLSGTSKAAGGAGTFTALGRFRRSIEIPAQLGWSLVVPMFLGAMTGARFVSKIDPHLVKPGVAIVLSFVWILTATRKSPGAEAEAETKLTLRGTLPAQMAVAFAIGTYDGLVGPGTGMFLLFSMVYLGGTSFLAAAGISKLLNLTSNVASILYFLWQGTILGPPLLVMIPGQMIGARLGANCALRYGSTFVRNLALWVTAALIAKLLWDTLHL